MGYVKLFKFFHIFCLYWVKSLKLPRVSLLFFNPSHFKYTVFSKKCDMLQVITLDKNKPI